MLKKSHPNFNVPNYGTKNRKRVKDRWRKQRGIDNKKRTKKNFMGAEPNIGYRNSESLRGVRASGNRIMLVHNLEELKNLVAQNKLMGFDITVAKGISRRKKQEMVKFAKTSRVLVTNE